MNIYRTFVYQKKVCSECWDLNVNSTTSCNLCGKNERIFSGANTRDEFCHWLFSGENNGATVICHNFKGYDSFPILAYLYQNGMRPDITPSGVKNMSVFIPVCNIRMIDSMNFLPNALSKLLKMFGIHELKKGYFPHLFNRKENQNAVLDHLPDIKFYNPDGMKPEDRREFREWYSKNQHAKFDFQQELVRYFQSDVDILRRCCLNFRSMFKEEISKTEANPEGIDPFENCITIASACNLVFRTNFLRPETIGIMPAQGYNPEAKHSIKALKWLRYISELKGIHIQYARNGGEKYIGDYRVDGYHESENGEKIVFEFHGCFWHGCPRCYSRDTINAVNKMAMDDLHQRTLEKMRYLESQGYTYIFKWECDFEKNMKENGHVKLFIDGIKYVTPVEPRDAFTGGRTEAFKLFHEIEENEQIKYYDVTSLYPYINKTGKVAVGHPKITTEHFSNISEYEGLIKCRVQPPRALHIQVLPTKINNKLLFPLCRTCAEEQQSTECCHSYEERALTGTWVTDELKKALEKGYEIEEIHEVWHFDTVEQYDPDSKTGGLFTDYINKFFKMKQEASGWPSWCKSKEHKHRYIQDYFEKEGIWLEYDKILENRGLRSLAKLMFNSFWGKFGQRNNLPQVDHISDSSIYFDKLTSDKQEVTSVQFVSDEMVEMRWKNKDEFVEDSRKTNVVIAAYTTAQARLKLYGYLERLGDCVLYADTDSIIFTVKKEEWEPPLGDYLGDLTDEVPGKKITQFATGGPKNYAYKVQVNDGEDVQTVCKVRGITLNYKNSLDINFDVVKEMVTGTDVKRVTVKDDHKIMRDSKNSRIITGEQSKDYKIVFDKRVIVSDFKTIPYGY